MSIDFPNSPTVNDLFRVGSVTWRWNGTQWVSSYREFTPDQDDRVRVWLDSGDPSTVLDSAGAVTDWMSRDALGRRFAQATAGSRPTTGVTTLNGLNVVDLAGDYITSADPAADWSFLHDGSAYAVFAVAKMGAVADPDARYALLGTNGESSGNVGVVIRWDDRAAVSRNEVAVLYANATPDPQPFSAASADGFWPANAYHLFTCLVDGDAAVAADRVRMSVDGGAYTATNALTNAASSADAAGTLDIGAGGTGAVPMTGSLAALIIVEGALTADRVAEFQQYLADRWGLTLA